MNPSDESSETEKVIEQASLAAADAEAAEESAQQAEAAARDAQSAVKRMAAAIAAEKAAIELFELCTAILLACGAIFAGLAGYQNGLWSGNAVSQFTAASIQTTKAASSAAMANALIGHDLHVYIEARRIIWEGLLAKKDSSERDVLMHQASGLLLQELGPLAYQDLGLPDEAARSASTLGTDDLSEQNLAGVTRSTLSDAYYEAMYRESKEESEKAQAIIQQASDTSTVGDQFSLASVFYTVSLALAGIGLVFKTRVRWSFFVVGFGIFICTTVYLTRLKWA